MHTGHLKQLYRAMPENGATTDQKIGPFKTYRSVWISDVHLGSRGTNYQAFVNFLDRFSAEDIYLLGDILDFMQSSRAPFSQQCMDAYQKLLRHGRKGAYLWVVPGNHDSRLRRFITKPAEMSEREVERLLDFRQGAVIQTQRYSALNGGKDEPLNEVQRLLHELLLLGRISFHNNVVHPTVANQRIFGSHGDEFDAIIRIAVYLNKILGPEAAGYLSRFVDKQGTTLREAIFIVSTLISRNIRTDFSLAHMVQAININGEYTLPKYATDFLSAMNDAIIDKRDHNSNWRDEPTAVATVYGHDHIPGIYRIPSLKEGTPDTYYMNCGSWLGDNCTALVEDMEGTFSLIKWDPVKGISDFTMADYAKRPPPPKGWEFVESVKL